MNTKDDELFSKVSVTNVTLAPSHFRSRRLAYAFSYSELLLLLEGEGTPVPYNIKIVQIIHNAIYTTQDNTSLTSFYFSLNELDFFLPGNYPSTMLEAFMQQKE